MNVLQWFYHRLPIIFIVAGCALILSIAGVKAYTSHQQNQYVRMYQLYQIESLVDENEGIQNIEPAETMVIDELPNTYSVPEQDSDDNSKSESLDDMGLVGILKLPKIDLTVAIGSGVKSETLQYTVGHFKSTALPGEIGNCCIIGHRSYLAGEFFNRLNELEIGDDIFVDHKNSTYQYVVTEAFVVDPKDTWVLDQTNDAQITLITCTPIRVATHRLIIKGVLVEKN